MKHYISVRGATENNLDHLDLDIPRDSLTVVTGVSGSGKSSLAFDTLFKEGQRKYIESLSAYARQFIGQVAKPQVESIQGLSPTIAIDQKTVNRNPRSTVGTITGLYDFLRLLFARVGTPHCPQCGKIVQSQSLDQITNQIWYQFQHQEIFLSAPVIRERKGEYRKEQSDYRLKGYRHLFIDGTWQSDPEQILELDRYVKHDIDVLVDTFLLEEKKLPRLRESLEKCQNLSGHLIRVFARPSKNHPGETLGNTGIESDETDRESRLPKNLSRGQIMSTSMSCTACSISLPELEPRLFSFNNPQGACEKCGGIGLQKEFNPERIVRDPNKSVQDGALACITDKGTVVFGSLSLDELDLVARHNGFSLDTPWKQLRPEQQQALLYGGDAELSLPRTSRLARRNRGQGKRRIPGIMDELQRVWDRWHIHILEKYMDIQTCPACKGLRLNPAALAVRYRERSINELAQMSIGEAYDWFNQLKLQEYEQQVGRELFKEIRTRLGFLHKVGLSYLNLDRSAATLSGGEGQRIRLASQVGSGLQGVLYVLDEPSIGLHPRDNQQLLQTLHALRNLGNTLIVVEHDEETMRQSDYLIDIGPGAGVRGGKLMAAGKMADILASPHSPTGMYMRGERQIHQPAVRRAGNGKYLVVKGARAHNLQGIDVSIPLGTFVGLTGVSGSGKSTLVNHILAKALANHFNHSAEPAGEHDSIEGLENIHKMIEISQSPIGRTPRSNPATYTGVFGPIRDLFATLPEARMRGYTKSRFSFNVKGGRCEACGGAGIQEIDMQLLMNVTIPCEECGGKRFNDATLEVHFKSKSIRDVLEMTVEEALIFFKDQPDINKTLVMLHEIGLGYIKLGQPSTTLSGGEAQRVKLATELQKTSGQQTLYLLDEPTTGLHFEDIARLLASLQELVNKGHTVLVIEHNLDLIRCADYLIDLGPEGGSGGGKIVAQGTPEEIAKCKDSYTGQALGPLLEKYAQQNSTNPRLKKLPKLNSKKEKTDLSSAKPSRDLVIRGAYKNNLKNIHLTIPQGKLTVVTGVSGSGKSTLAFDTLFAEGQRRFLESLSSYARRFLGKLEKGEVEEISGLSPAIAIDQVTANRSPKSTLATSTELYDYFRLLYARLGSFHCPQCKSPLDKDLPSGMIKKICSIEGSGQVQIFAPLYMPRQKHDFFLDQAEHLTGSATSLLKEGFYKVLIGEKLYELKSLPAKIPGGQGIYLYIDTFSLNNIKVGRLRESLEMALEKGHGTVRVQPPEGSVFFMSTLNSCAHGHYFSSEEIEPKHFSFNSHWGMCPLCDGLGVLGSEVCPECEGTRLKKPFSLVTVQGLNMGQLNRLTLTQALDFFKDIKFSTQQKPVALPLLREIRSRLNFLCSVGLGYLGLDRTGNTLSGGEAQRIRLASQIGSGLEGVLYVLDEPTIGLHPKDTEHLMNTLKALQELGNTLLVVEHDPEVMARADHIVELGPGAGEQGGEVVYTGSYTSLLKDKHSLTASCLNKNWNSGSSQSSILPQDFIPFTGINLHNLNNFSIKLPLKGITVLAGISGSGKSTLMLESLAPALQKTLERLKYQAGVKARDPQLQLHLNLLKEFKIQQLAVVDQSPIGTTPRSSPITYGGVFEIIRELFANTPEARTRGYTKNRFSINGGTGRCEVCEGMGQIKVEMHFLSDVWVVCDSCKGKRFNAQTLAIEYQGKSISDVLEMRVSEACDFFANHKKVYRYLSLLRDIGLGSMRIGQSATTFSGGEAQRIKIAAELARGSHSQTLYILDEPTTGLHLHDVELLNKAIRALAEKGNAVWIIEHHLDLIRSADWVVELGLDQERKAQIVFEGLPSQLSKAKTDTGRALARRKM